MFGSPISEPKEPDRAALVFAATLVLVGGRQGSQCSIRKRKRWKKDASSAGAGAGGGMWSWGRLFSALALAFAFLFSSSPPLFQSVGSLGGAPPGVPRFRRAPLPPPAHNPQCGNSSTRACDDTAVHVAMTLDVAYLRGSMAAVYSVLKHASCPGDIIFHFLTTSEEGGTGEGGGGLSAVMRTSFPSLQFEVHRFDESLVRTRISPSVRHALEQPLNYARNYLASLLALCVARVIYLDSDLVVVDDIAKLWKTPLHGHAIAAPEYCHANFTSYFSPAFWSDSALSVTFSANRHRRAPCYFNTGVMVIDLNKWRAHGYTREIERWMEIQKQKRIYDLGSLPPFLLLFAGNVEPVHHRWNQHGLGGDNVVGSCRPLHPGPVSLLHWSGTGKPWVRLDSGQPCPLDSLWSPYDLFLPPPYT